MSVASTAARAASPAIGALVPNAGAVVQQQQQQQAPAIYYAGTAPGTAAASPPSYQLPAASVLNAAALSALQTIANNNNSNINGAANQWGGLSFAQQNRAPAVYRRRSGAIGATHHATTVFDLINLPVGSSSGIGIVQAMPPRAYDLVIDGAPYSVIALEGFTESAYLRNALADRAASTGGGGPLPALGSRQPRSSFPLFGQQPNAPGGYLAFPNNGNNSGNNNGNNNGGYAIEQQQPACQQASPLSIQLSCGAGGMTPSARVRDAVFLLMAYGITSTACLDLNEQLCLLDIVLAYGLPLAFGDWLTALSAPAPDGLPGRVCNIAGLCHLVDSVGASLDRLMALAPGVSQFSVARALARTALGALLRSPSGDAPASLAAILLVLAGARGPADPPYVWNNMLTTAFGEAYALDRLHTNPLGALPVSLTGSHMALIAEPAVVTLRTAALSNGYDEDDDEEEEEEGGNDGQGCAGLSAPRRIEAAIKERVDRFYGDKTDATAGRVREALTALIGRWIATQAGAGADITVTYGPLIGEIGRSGDGLLLGAGGACSLASQGPNAVRQITFCDVRYEPVLTVAQATAGVGEGDAYYSYAPANPTVAGERVRIPLRALLGQPWTRLGIRVPNATGASCAQPEILLATVGWPLPLSVSPFHAATCSVGVDIRPIVSALPTDAVLRSALASATSP